MDFGGPRLLRGMGRATGEDILKMIWTRSDTIGLAKTSCTQCHGYGLRTGRTGKEYPCNCVFRAIFRACYLRFRECAARERHISRVSLEVCSGGKDSRHMYSRKMEDYMADFCLVSRRALNELEYRVFRFHFVLGADWKLCCQQLKIDRGTFFHVVYRVEQRLGRTFRELEPYGLYPLDEYFASRIPGPPAAGKVAVMPVRTKRPVQAPVRKSA